MIISPIIAKRVNDWNSCPKIELPVGAANITCDQGSCVAVCLPGYSPVPGHKRATCKTDKEGNRSWHGRIAPCHTCPPLGEVNATCSFSLKNRKVCKISCPKNNRVEKRVKCICSRSNGTCTWNLKTLTTCDIE